MEVKEIEFHRNGISGDPFYIVKFVDTPYKEIQNMIAVVFNQEVGQCPIAVFDEDKLKEGEIRFGYNSWRGDHYAGFLYEAIDKYKAKQIEDLEKNGGNEE